ncbi:MAG: hypothetical protein HY721_15625 [Planctomycetes bacterium]|nr:hypothetical protein [Planctomycetota bacterium]
MRRMLLSAGGLAVAFVLAASVQAQYNSAGTIRNDGFNMLVPMLNPPGCGGGGAGTMALQWAAPHDMRLEDPKAGDEWADIDFGGASPSSGWGAGQLVEAPTWVSYEYLETSFSLPAGTIPRLNRLSWHDSDGGNSLINWLNTNVVLPAGLPALPGDNVTAIATTYVRNKGPAGLFYLCTASDDSILVYVNNKLALNKSVCRGGSLNCQEVTPAFLPSGVSRITIQVWEGGGGFDGTLGIRLTEGGANLADGNEAIDFIGPGGPDDVGQLQYSVNRSIAGFGYNCPNTEPATVTIQGVAGVGADGDMLTVEETIFAADPTQIALSNISNGGAVSDVLPPPRRDSDADSADPSPGPDFDHRRAVGFQCGGGSITTYDGGTGEYTSDSNTGGDLWSGSNDFEFAYSRVVGDFDISVKLTSRTHSSGAGRWGKFGLIARHHIDGCTRHSIMQDHMPNLVDARSFSARKTYAGCDPMTEDRGTSGPAVSAHPPYYRLTRVGNVLRGYASDDATVEADPSNGALWTRIGPPDDWGAAAPEALFVGYANSEHGDGGCNVQTITFKVLNFAKTGLPPVVPIGKKITWQVPRADLNAGVSYSVDFPDGNLPLSGVVVGEAVVDGPGRVGFLGSGDPDGDGCLQRAHDVGSPPTPGSTSYDAGTGVYTQSGSGSDIWDGGDHMHFAYAVIEGDFQVSCRLVNATNPPNARWGRIGLMARQSCDFNSKYSFANAPYRGEALNDQDVPAHVTRQVHGVANTTTRDQMTPSGHIAGNWPQDPVQPFWLRLTRKGNYFYSEFAMDEGGEPGPWAVAGGDTWAGGAPAKMLVGPVSSSHGTAGSNLLTWEFDNYKCEPVGPIPANVCTKGEALLATDFEDDFPGDDVVTNNAGAWTPQVVDVGGNKRLRLTGDGSGGLAGVSHFSLDGLNAGDLALQIDFDVWVTKTDANIEADGGWIGLQQGVLADYVGRIGEGGGALGIRQGDELHNRRASFGTEVDTWDGGYGSHDPPNGFGANAGGRRWHTGFDFNETFVSAMDDVRFGATYANVLLNNEGGAHISMKYQPNDDNAVLEAWLSFNDGSLAPTVVLRAVGPRLRGDVVLTLSAANGGATETFDIDNLSVSEICCEGSAESVSIDSAGGGGDHTGDTGSTVALHATAGGLDGDATYTWSVVSGSATLAPAGADCGVTGTADGDVTVEVKVSDGVCGNEATAQHTVTFTTPGGKQKPMDMNQDGKQDLSDAVAILGHLFLGAKGPPCGDGTISDAANLALLDGSPSGVIDLSDPVRLLNFLFLGGPRPANCVDDDCPCIVIKDCPTVCE